MPALAVASGVDPLNQTAPGGRARLHIRRSVFWKEPEDQGVSSLRKVGRPGAELPELPCAAALKLP